MKKSRKYHQTRKAHKSRGAPKKHSVITAKQAVALNDLLKVRNKSEADDAEFQGAKSAVIDAFGEVVSWSAVVIQLYVMASSLVAGDWARALEAMEGVLSSVWSICRRRKNSVRRK